MDELAQKLAPVRARILNRAVDSMTELDTLLSGLEDGVGGEVERERAYIIAHNLAGVGSTVGLDAIGEAARDLETIVRDTDPRDRSWRPAHARLLAAVTAAKEAS